MMRFLFMEMTWLRYFVPIIRAGNARGIRSQVFVGPSNGKYNCPRVHFSTLQRIANEEGFELRDTTDLCPGTYFTIEGVGPKGKASTRSAMPENTRVISIPFNGDFVLMAPDYHDKVDRVSMLSKPFAEFYDTVYPNNVYVGCPKFSLDLEPAQINEKYSFDPARKKALIIAPKRRDRGRMNVSAVYDALHDLGFEIIVKTRGKDPITPGIERGDHYFEDASWFPHDTMEFIHVSDIAFNFGSGAVKECVMLDTPFVDFKVKSWRKLFEPLYDYDYCANFEPDYDTNELVSEIERLTSNDFGAEFERARKEWLSEGHDSADKMVDLFLEVNEELIK